MFRRIIFILVFLVCLCGCQVSKDSLLTNLDTILDDATVSSISSKVNMNKGLMSYYLQPSIGRKESNATNSVFVINGNDVIMNIDVSSIVSQKYYASSSDIRAIGTFGNQIYEKKGVFISSTDLVRDYLYRLFEVSSEQYGIILQTSNIIMVAVVPLGDVYNVSSEMMTLIRGCRVDEEAVVSAYSQKEMINYQKETLDIFEKVYPEEGTLLEMNEE